MQEWKARIAIRSRSDTAPTSSNSSSNSLAPLLCYVCHTTLTSKGTRAAPALYPPSANLSAPVSLPAWAAARFVSGRHDDVLINGVAELSVDEPEVRGRRIGREEMRRAIGEFILND